MVVEDAANRLQTPTRASHPIRRLSSGSCGFHLSAMGFRSGRASRPRGRRRADRRLATGAAPGPSRADRRRAIRGRVGLAFWHAIASIHEQAAPFPEAAGRVGAEEDAGGFHLRLGPHVGPREQQEARRVRPPGGKPAGPRRPRPPTASPPGPSAVSPPGSPSSSSERVPGSPGHRSVGSRLHGLAGRHDRRSPALHLARSDDVGQPNGLDREGSATF